MNRKDVRVIIIFLAVAAVLLFVARGGFFSRNDAVVADASAYVRIQVSNDQ